MKTDLNPEKIFQNEPLLPENVIFAQRALCF